MNELRTHYALSKNEKHTISKWSRIVVPTAKWRIETAKMQLMAKHKGKILEGDLVAHLICPKNRRRDPSNYMEFFLDALQGVFYENDKQVRDSRTSEWGGKDFVFRIFKLKPAWTDTVNRFYIA